MKNPTGKTLIWRHDYLPLLCIGIIIFVCNMANIFILRKPLYIFATLPLLVLTIMAWKKVRRK